MTESNTSSGFVKLVAPVFFDYEISVEEYYNDAVGDAIANNTDVFCHFEGDRHCYLPVSFLTSRDINNLTITEELLKVIEITDETIFE